MAWGSLSAPVAVNWMHALGLTAGSCNEARPERRVMTSMFMPFLAITLLGLLNGKRIPKGWANRWHTNTALAITAILFIALGIQQLIKNLAPLFGG